MDVVVFGAGSLGSLVGALLARAHDVTLVGRDPHAAAIREGGLRVTGVDSFTVSPRATTDGTGLDADVAIVTVKAFDTGAAARVLSTGAFDAVVSLQNGMGNEDVLAAQLSCPVLAGTATYGAVLEGPGHVAWRGGGSITLGPWSDGSRPVARRVADAFREADVPTTFAEAIELRLWEKVTVNAAINPVTALVRGTNGVLLEGDAAALRAPIARECAAVARAEDVALGDEDAVEAVSRVADETAANHSSMYQDVTSGRRTEIDAITGYVVERADCHGVRVPTNRTLCALVRAWEQERGLR